MNKTPWKMEKVDDFMLTVIDGKTTKHSSYYKINYKGYTYGFFSETSILRMQPDKAMEILIAMLNDAHSLALSDKFGDKNE